MNKLFDKCPACGGPLIITECRCAACNLQMRGDFSPGAFTNLTEDQLTFIRVFLRVRGNLSELERTLGVSYPTIRNKLDDINDVLERESTTPVKVKPPPAEDRRSILQNVADGKLSAEEALLKIQNVQE